MSGFNWENSHLINTDHVTDLTRRLKLQFYVWKRNLETSFLLNHLSVPKVGQAGLRKERNSP